MRIAEQTSSCAPFLDAAVWQS